MNHFRERSAVELLTRALALCCLFTAAGLVAGCGSDNNPAPPTTFNETLLVSDLPDTAPVTDEHLVNAWGIAASGTGPFWIADNGPSLSTLYDGNGTPFPAASPLVVNVPPEDSAPTGLVFNGTTDFVLSEGGKSGPALFIFDTESGTLAGWNQTGTATEAVTVVDRSGEALYKGLAVGSTAGGNFLYATDFENGAVDVFDKNFTQVSLPGSFHDADIPAGFAPFGIQNIGGKLYVTYAKQDENHEDDVPGAGNGYVDVFDTNGQLVKRFASQGTLNSPWGLVVAPSSFGTFAGAVLVGNFGDGRINAFNASSGAFLGQLPDAHGGTLTIPGLWGLIVGNGASGGSTDTIYFTAGPFEEQHGLFGSVKPA